MRVVIVRIESRRDLYHIVKVMYSLGFNELVLVDPKIHPRAAKRVYNRLLREKKMLYEAEVLGHLSQVPGSKLCFRRAGGYSPKLVDLTKYDNFVFYGENGDFSKEELSLCDQVVTFPGDYTLPTIVTIALWEYARRTGKISWI